MLAYDQIKSLPATVNQQLQTDLGNTINTLTPKTISTENQVEKVIFELGSGEKIESVLMKFNHGSQSLCISSQVCFA